MNTFALAKTVVVNNAGEVLLLRRSQTDTRRPGQWDLPGGFVENGEDVLAAAKREVLEEAGLVVNELTLFYGKTEITDFGNGTWLAFVGYVQGRPKVTLSFEHDQHQWLKLDDALKALVYERQNNMLRQLKDAGLETPSKAA